VAIEYLHLSPYTQQRDCASVSVVYSLDWLCVFQISYLLMFPPDDLQIIADNPSPVSLDHYYYMVALHITQENKSRTSYLKAKKNNK
jgi:hypothetical protein